LAAATAAIAAALEASDAARVTRASLEQASAPQFSGFASQLEAIDADFVTIAAASAPIAAEDARIAAKGATIGGSRCGARRASSSDRRSRRSEGRRARGDRGGRSHDWGQSARRGRRWSRVTARSMWRLRRSARVALPSAHRAPSIEARSAAIVEAIAAKFGICGALASSFEALVRPSEAQRGRRAKLAVIRGSRGDGSGSIGGDRRAMWVPREALGGHRAALDAGSVARRRGRGAIGALREALAMAEPRPPASRAPLACVTPDLALRTSAMTTLHGGCHCGSIKIEFETSAAPGARGWTPVTVQVVA